MTELVIFLEEPSAREMLKGLLPKILPDNVYPRYVVFEGKQDLDKQLPIKLKAWCKPDCIFVVLRDQDNGNCLSIKQGLMEKCNHAGKTCVLIRIACHELESWYLGDLTAVEQAIGPDRLSSKQNNRKFRTPDRLSNASEELSKLSPQYQKVSGSRAIGKCLNIKNNRSDSFHVFMSGIQRIVK